MVDTYTTGKLGLIEPARGGYVDTWDEPLYANWQTLDAALSGTTTITLSSSNVILTVPTFPSSTNPPSVATSAQNLRLYMTGTMSSNLTVYLPATVGGIWIADNNTTGGYTVTIKTTSPGSTGIDLTTGGRRIIYSDGVDVKYADNIASPAGVPSGAIQSFGMLTVPSGWLICDGTAYSRTTYSDLYSAIGTTWGIGDGTTTFNVPNLKGAFLRGLDTSGTVDRNGSFSLNGNTTNGSNSVTNISSTTNIQVGYTVTGSGIPANTVVSSITSSTAITISKNATATATGVSLTYTRNIGIYEADGVGPLTINDPGHFHYSNYPSDPGLVAGGGSYWQTPVAITTTTAKTGITITNTILETRPKNYAVQYCIKT